MKTPQSLKLTLHRRRERRISGSPHPWPCLLVIVVCLLTGLFVVTSPLELTAQDYEAYQRARTGMENASSRIRTAEGAVGQVLMGAMNGKHGEFQKWGLVDEKMIALGQAVDEGLPAMSSNAAVILSYDPNAYIQSVDLGHPFDGNLNMARDKKRQLLEMAKQENAKLDKVNQMLAKTDKALLNVARGIMAETIEGFLPDEKQLVGEASVIVLGAWFGPPGIVAAGIVVGATFTFNAFTNLYYNAQAVADQARALNDLKQSLLATRASLEKNVRTLTDGAREMQQIEQVLEKHQKKVEEFRIKVDAAVKGMSEQARAAFQKKQADLTEEARKRAATPKPPINLSTGVHCMTPIPAIQPGDYTGEVDSIVSQMESYSKAVEDGGDPDNFYDLVSTWAIRHDEQYRKVNAEYDQKYKAYGEASNVCWRATDRAWQQYRSAGDALWAAYRGRRWDDAASAAARSIQAAYDGAVRAAYAGLCPYGQALISPYREMTRLSTVIWRTRDMYSVFNQRVEGAVRFRTTDYWKQAGQWKTRLDDAAFKLGQTLSKVPYNTQGWKERAANVDHEASYAMTWGSNVEGVKSMFLSWAEQMRQVDKDVKEAAKVYDSLLPEVLRIINVGQSEMGTYVTRYGKLINNPRVGRFYFGGWAGGSQEPFKPDSSETDVRVEWLLSYLKKNLSYTDPAYLKEAKTTDWLGFASVFQKKADELSFYTEWADKFRGTVAVAASRLDRISRALTNQGFYANRNGLSRDRLRKELTEPQWAAITREVEKYAPPEARGKIPWVKFQPWEGMNLWQKLYAAQTLLYMRVGEEMRNYAQVRAGGGFMPVPEKVIKPIEENWRGLRALCEQYEALAGPIRETIGKSAEEIGKDAQPVWDTWSKMPPLSQSLVTDDYNRFRSAAGWLEGYISAKSSVMQGLLLPPSGNMATQLDDLILGYAPAFEKWKRQVEEQNRQFEEARRRQEEEQKRRVEEEKRKGASESTAVQDLYRAFKGAYESRNDALLVSYLSKDWQAVDGTTITGLQNNLRRTFRVFDEIRYDMQNLTIQKQGEGRYAARYDLTITSRIYKRNLKHEEKATISEEVIIESSGKAKIGRTMEGRFWMQ